MAKYIDPLAKDLARQKHIDAFDTTSMGKELSMAVEFDRKYQITDDLKKKTIVTARSYDEFKNRIACADMKPISSKDLQNIAKSERVRNKAVGRRTKGGNRRSGKGATAAFKVIKPTEVPTSGSIFERNWKRHTPTVTDKYEYLQLTGPTNLSKLFPTEMDSTLVSDVVHVVQQHWVQHVSITSMPTMGPEILFFLEELSKVGRFSLGVQFWGPSEKKIAAELFDSLMETAPTEAAGPSNVFDFEEGVIFDQQTVQEVRGKFEC